MKTILVPLVLLASGCGLGVHVDRTNALTAPFHDHQDDIAQFPLLAPVGAPPAIAVPKARVGSFGAYYPRPVGFTLGTAPGATELHAWTEYTPALPPERVLSALFTTALSSGTGDRVLDARVVEFSWYELGATIGGRITSLLVVHGPDGVVYEGLHTTTGRAPSPDILLNTHAREWLAQRSLVKALEGGTP